MHFFSLQDIIETLEYISIPLLFQYFSMILVLRITNIYNGRDRTKPYHWRNEEFCSHSLSLTLTLSRQMWSEHCDTFMSLRKQMREKTSKREREREREQVRKKKSWEPLLQTQGDDDIQKSSILFCSVQTNITPNRVVNLHPDHSSHDSIVFVNVTRMFDVAGTPCRL